MINKSNIFSFEECRGLISNISSKNYATPNECLAKLMELNALFREAVKQKSRFDNISISQKDNIENLLYLCAPKINYNIEECFKQSVNNDRFKIIVEYSLNINSTAEDIAKQVEDFYVVACMALTNPILQKGVTPSSILKIHWDRYAQEAGVDDSEEIRKIVARIISRLFTDNIEYQNACSNNSIEVGLDVKETTTNFGKWQESFTDLMDSIKLLHNSFVESICNKCKQKQTVSTSAAAKLAKWISIPDLVKIEISKIDNEPYMDYQRRELIRPFPKISYFAKLDEEEKQRKLNSFWGILERSSTESILVTSIEKLKEDIEDIPHQPIQDISISLRRVIERNFDVNLIEINNENDRYATPEYFDVARSNVERVVTTRPAVINPERRVIFKGLYLVPLNICETPNNNLRQF